MTGRHEELVAGWFDGTLGPAEEAELLEALRADGDFARAFAGEVEVHRGLQFSSAQSEAGDLRSADRILHFVRASQEETQFMEGVKQRALAGNRRRSGRFIHPGTSLIGPVIASAAAVLVAALVALLAFVSHRQKLMVRQDIAERAEAARQEQLANPPREETKAVAPQPPRIDEAQRRKQIEEELRLAAEERRRKEPPDPGLPKPPLPEEKPVVAETKPDAPPKPEPTRVEAAPPLARLEGVQGEVLLGNDRTPAASGAELRDGAAVETVGAQSSAVLRFADGTRLELAGEARLHEKLAGKRSAGRGLTLARGSVSADVAKQPAGQSFLFMTPQAEVQVVGTRLSVHSGVETRVDVQEGQVRVTTLRSGQVTTLSAGQGAEIAPSGPPRLHLMGLRAVYYDQNTYKGQTLDRADRGIDLVLDDVKNELPPVGSDRNFGVKWEGRFLAEKEGDYVFLLSVDGHVRFVFAGQELVADQPGYFHGIQRSVLRRKLAAGWHELLVEYADDSGKSRCALRYVPPGAKPAENDDFQREDSGFPIPPRLFTHGRK